MFGTRQPCNDRDSGHALPVAVVALNNNTLRILANRCVGMTPGGRKGKCR